MKKVCSLVIAVLIGCQAMAQSYARMWQKVNELERKDLPTSILRQLEAIDRKARDEHEVGQLMKVFLKRYEVKAAISPDSLEGIIPELQQWEARTSDLADKAVLNFMMAAYRTKSFAPADSVGNALLRKAFSDPALLDRTSTVRYSPIVRRGPLSDGYFHNSLLHLLYREATSRFPDIGWIYDDLIAYYEAHEQWDEGLIVRLDRLLKRSNLNYPVLRKQIVRMNPKDGGRLIDSLRHHYPETEAKIYLAIEQARILQSESRYREAKALIDEGISRYPKARALPEARRVSHELLVPVLSVGALAAYPGESTRLQVSYRNLHGLKAEWFRLSLAPTDNRLQSADKITPALLRQSGLKVSEHTLRLTAPGDIMQHTDTLQLPTPDEGIYYLRITADGPPERSVARIVSVSRYAGIAESFKEGSSRMYVVDKWTGSTQAGLKVDVLDAKGKLIRTALTDDAGKVDLPESFNRILIYRNRPNTLPISTGWMNSLSPIEDSPTTIVSLYTDRVIYRPGQTVQVAGLVKRIIPDGDSVRVVAGSTHTVYLRSANPWKIIASSKVTTDEFGTFHTSFGVPRNATPGAYTIESGGCMNTIQIEEYKRPTFEITLDAPATTYQLNDTVTLAGRVATYSGVPMANMSGEYSVSCSPVLRNGYMPNEVLKDTFATDADGRFTLRLPLTKPEGWAEYLNYRFEANARITSATGETHEARRSVYALMQEVNVQVEQRTGVIMREHPETLTFRTSNFEGTPISTSVSWRLYHMSGGHKTLSAEQISPSNTELRLPVDKLASGEYVLEYAAINSKGKIEPASETTLTLFSRRDKKIVTGTDFVWTSADEFAPDQTVDVYYGSPHDSLTVFFRISAGNQILQSEQFRYDGEVRHFTLDYKQLSAQYRSLLNDNRAQLDGVTLMWGYYLHGQFYQQIQTVSLSLPDKQLKLKWTTFRDRLRPGQAEEWTLNVSYRGRPVDARMIATLYDASLDQFLKHVWYDDLYLSRRFSSYNLFKLEHSGSWWGDWQWTVPEATSFDLLNPNSFSSFSALFEPNVHRLLGRREVFDMLAVEAAAPALSNSDMESRNAKQALPVALMESDTDREGTRAPIPLRTQSGETAFFYPALRTDAQGNVRLSFTMPDVLTSWNFMGLAFTKDYRHGLLKAQTRTEKEFMIQPNLPRYLRRGDQGSIAASLQNMSDKRIKGVATLELLNPLTDKVLYRAKERFDVSARESSAIQFVCRVDDAPEIVVCRIMADGDTYSDGEQQYLAVLDDRQVVVETLPLQLRDAGRQTVNLKDLPGRSSATATDGHLSVELTTNAAWYAIQSLPVMAEPLAKDVVNVANGIFAHQLTQLIVRNNPRIEAVVRSWASTPSADKTSVSRLAKNQELKTLLLEASPWEKLATDETEAHARLIELFDPNKANAFIEDAGQRLAALQQADGSLSWYAGMPGNRYMTQYVGVLFARMKHLDIFPSNLKIYDIYQKLFKYLKAETDKDIRQMKLREAKGEPSAISETTIDFLYMCALDGVMYHYLSPSAEQYLIGKLRKHATPYSIAEKARLASTMQKLGARSYKDLTDTLIRSISQYLVRTPELGAYFDTPKAVYSWRGYRIPTHVAAMEAISQITPNDTSDLSDMALWLLKQKQVQRWSNPMASAEAVYALLNYGGVRLDSTGQVSLQIGDYRLTSGSDALGYVKAEIPHREAASAAKITIEKKGDGIGWGSVYYRYKDKRTNVRASNETGLSVNRTLLKDGREVSGSDLHVGDKITVSLRIHADRDMDFVQLSDARAACMEPVEALSGYTYSEGLSCYSLTRDASSEFYIDHLRKGTYTLTYDVYIDREGQYSYGAAQIQSAYAPEFVAQTSGRQLIVKSKK